MNKEQYETLEDFAIALFYFSLGIAISIMIISVVGAVQINGTMDINGTITNVTFDIPINLTIVNHTIITNNSYYYNVTTNYTIYNITNITNCYNCSINQTNITYFNVTNYNFTNNFNGSNFTAGDYYNKVDVDSKFNNYLLKSEYNPNFNISNSTLKQQWRTADTYISIGTGIALILGLFGFLIGIRAMTEG